MYDQYIHELYRCAETDALPCRRYVYDAAQPGAWKQLDKEELILRSSMAYELGGSDHWAIGASAFLETRQQAAESEVLIYGRDLPEIREDCDYARFTVITLQEDCPISPETYSLLRKIDYIRFHIYPEGYMLRISSARERESVRISRQAAQNGITFAAVGAGMIREYLKIPEISSVQILFFTDKNADYARLKQIAGKINLASDSLNTILNGLVMDCTTCGLKSVCDEVEGLRELHFANTKNSLPEG